MMDPGAPRPVAAARGLFEAHLIVSSLDRSLAFYRDLLGLTVGHVMADPHAAFLWIGPGRTSMLGLWTGSAPVRVSSHIAFDTGIDEVLAAPDALRAAGLTPLDFAGDPTDEPVVLAWMPAASVYFQDPDGNLLEYLAMLPQAPRPELGVVPWHTWNAAQD